MEDSVEVRAGDRVHLLDKSKQIVLDTDGSPLLYQITAVYREFMKVGLVTYYGEYVGTHNLDNIIYVSSNPIFVKEDYTVDTKVIWIDHEDVYEGVIDSLGDNTAKIRHIKKLLPINHTVRIPYWKIPDGRKAKIIASKRSHQVNDELKLGGEITMSTKANIILRNANSIRREIFLYQHADAHPNNLTLILSELLREAYLEFKDLGDVDWFLNPSKLASFLVVKSVPKATEDIKELMKQLPDSTRYQLESMYFLGMPTLLVENNRVSNCNYEYIITLSEDVESNFFGYELEINKMSANKLINTVMTHKENMIKEKSKVK